MKKIAIFGAGGFAREVLWLLHDLDLADSVAGFFESDEYWQPRHIAGLEVLPASHLNPVRQEVVIAAGSPSLRKKMYEELGTGFAFPTLVHPSVLKSRGVSIGSGSIICAGCILTCDIVLGEHVHLNLSSTVGHDCIINDFATTAPAVNISGKCQIGTGAFIGTNACLREGLKVADWATIGMGAVLVADAMEPGIYLGNPARRH